jgi:TusA-related sulfurtransferase
MADKTLIALGMKCPRPLFEVHRFIKELSPGQTLKVLADDPAFRLDIEAWCRRTGHTLVEIAVRGDHMEALITRA